MTARGLWSARRKIQESKAVGEKITIVRHVAEVKPSFRVA